MLNLGKKGRISQAGRKDGLSRMARKVYALHVVRVLSIILKYIVLEV